MKEKLGALAILFLMSIASARAESYGFGSVPAGTSPGSVMSPLVLDASGKPVFPKFSEEKDAYGATIETMKDHSIYRLIQKNAASFKAKISGNAAANAGAKLLTGKSAVEITDHYLGMVDFLAENTGGFGTGDGHQGYIIARTHTSNKDLERLTELAPTAFRKYEEKKGEMNWEDWVQHFDGNPQLALKSLIFRIGWSRTGLIAGNPSTETSLKKLNTVYPYSLDAAYSVYPLKKDAFQLPFSSSQNFGDGKRNDNYWGQAYKTISGMNLALAGKVHGYSEEDIRAMVSRAGLVYESSDLLYDHLRLKDPEIATTSDAVELGDQDTYFSFAKKVREKLRASPSLLGKLIGSIFGFPELGKKLPSDTGFDTDKDLVLVFLLLNYQYEDPQAFEKEFGGFFGQDAKGKKLRSLFEAAIFDARTMATGGDFVLEKLRKVPLAEINPCLGEPPFQGILQFRNQVKSILGYIQ